MRATVTASERLRSSMKDHDILWSVLRERAKQVATTDIVHELEAFQNGGRCSILIAVAIIELIVDRKKGLV